MKLRSGLARLRSGLAGHASPTRERGEPTMLHLRLAEVLRSRLTGFHLRLAVVLRRELARLHELRLPGLRLQTATLRPLCQSNGGCGQNCDGCKNVFHSCVLSLCKRSRLVFLFRKKKKKKGIWEDTNWVLLKPQLAL